MIRRRRSGARKILILLGAGLALGLLWGIIERLRAGSRKRFPARQRPTDGGHHSAPIERSADLGRAVALGGVAGAARAAESFGDARQAGAPESLPAAVGEAAGVAVPPVRRSSRSAEPATPALPRSRPQQ